MTCCRCNRTGRCSCSKEKRTCDSCLPDRLGNCQDYSRPNANTTSVATTSTRTASSSNTPSSSSSYTPQLVPTQITSTTSMTDTDPETQCRLPPNGTPTTTSITASIPSVSQTSNSTPSAHHSFPSVHLSTIIQYHPQTLRPQPSFKR